MTRPDTFAGPWPPVTDVLLLAPHPAHRRRLRADLDAAALTVVATISLADTLARVHSRRYTLVLCVAARAGAVLEEEFAVLMDGTAPLARYGPGMTLYLPGIGIHARGVLLVDRARACDVSLHVGEAIARVTPHVTWSASNAHGGDRHVP